MQENTLTAALDRLSQAEQPLLYVLALVEKSHRTQLLEHLRKMEVKAHSKHLINMQECAPLLERLVRAHWIEAEHPYYSIHPDRQNKVLLHLIQHPQFQQLYDSLFSADLSKYINVYSAFWQILLQKQPDKVLTCQKLAAWTLTWHANFSQPVRKLLHDEAGQQLWQHLDQEVQNFLATHAMQEANATLTESQNIYRYLLDQLKNGVTLSPTLLAATQMQALLRGEVDQFAQLLADETLITEERWLYLLLQGHYKEARQGYSQLVEQYHAVFGKRKIELNPAHNLLATLTLLAGNETSDYPELRRLIKHGLKNEFGHAYLLLESLLDLLEGKTTGVVVHLLPDELIGLDGLVCALVYYWRELEAPLPQWRTSLIHFRDQLIDANYYTIRYEIETLLEAQYKVPFSGRDWYTRYKLQPMLQLFQRQEAWQHALVALAQINTHSSTKNAAQDNSRLAWLLSPSDEQIALEPKEQKFAKGQWSRGRSVTVKRLIDQQNSLTYLLEQDKKVLQYAKQYRGHYSYYSRQHSRYEIDGSAALPSLIGHPALYWADAPDVRIDLVAGQISLQLKKIEEQIEIKLIPNKIEAHTTLLLEKETPTRLTIYTVSHEIHQIANIIGHGLRVPQAAQTQLVEVISAIAPLLPIHTDLPELSTQLNTVGANSKLYAHLLPLQEGLRLQILVRPLEHGSWYPPGHGNEILSGELDGQTVQTQRSLTQEKAALKQVLASCPALLTTDDDQEWQLADPQAALEALTQLQAVDAQLLECIWPEGERMRIRARRNLQSLSFQLRRQGDWFVLSAQLQLDDGQVLSLRQLLQLIKQSRGRFIKLGDQDWLALDDHFKKRLEQLSLLAESAGDNDIRLGKLTAPLLAELAEESGGISGDAAWKKQLAQLNSLRNWQPAVPSTLQTELRDYQQEGYRWLSRLARWGVGACLADDMGLGKTVQALALLLERASGGPQLVVAPTSVTMNWQAESERFAPTLKLHPYHQKRDLKNLGPFDLVIASYGLLQQDIKAFSAQHWHSVVLDEAQAIKNAQTKRSQAAMALQADFRLAASGTPLENHLGELWNLFRFLNPGLLGSQQEHFRERFVIPIENGDNAARKALKTLIQPFILRRSKSQVLDELPARTEITYKISLSQEELHWYEALRQEAVTKFAMQPAEKKPLQVLAEITKLRRFCCHPQLVLPDSGLTSSKLTACRQIIEELLDNHHKALIFSQFVDHLSFVRQHLEQAGISYQYLDGATPPKERKARVDAFQAGKGDIFLISLKAGGTGLNLTAADYVIHLDPWWNPAVEDQASDRAHRIGQQRPVTVYRLVAEHTIEEQIVALHTKKRDLANSLLEGGELSAKLDADALLALLQGG